MATLFIFFAGKLAYEGIKHHRETKKAHLTTTSTQHNQALSISSASSNSRCLDEKHVLSVHERDIGVHRVFRKLQGQDKEDKTPLPAYAYELPIIFVGSAGTGIVPAHWGLLPHAKDYGQSRVDNDEILGVEMKREVRL